MTEFQQTLNRTLDAIWREERFKIAARGKIYAGLAWAAGGYINGFLTALNAVADKGGIERLKGRGT